MALWHSPHHNLLLFTGWAGESATAFPLAAFDYWSLMPHFPAAASKTNTGLGADGATQLSPGASVLPKLLHCALPNPQVAPAHGWRPPSWGCTVPGRVWCC